MKRISAPSAGEPTPPYSAGVVAATVSNINLSSAPATVDGVTLAEDDRILVKNQSSGEENGIYVFSSAGAALERATDYDTGDELDEGIVVYVQQGTANGDTLWTLVTDPPITIDTTSLVFEQYPSVKTGNTAFVDSTYGNNGSAQNDNDLKPYATIQAAIDGATAGDATVVAPGVYAEALDFGGKALVLDGEGVTGITAISNIGSGTHGRLGAFEIGENFIKVHSVDSEAQNWANLKIAKTAAEGMSPFGNAIGANNAVRIIPADGVADAGTDILQFDTDYVHLEGLSPISFTVGSITGGAPAPVLDSFNRAGYVIQSSLTTANRAPIEVTATNVVVSNISIDSQTTGNISPAMVIDDATNDSEGVVIRGCSLTKDASRSLYIGSDFAGRIEDSVAYDPTSTLTGGFYTSAAIIMDCTISNCFLGHSVGAVTYSGKLDNVTSEAFGFTTFSGEAVNCKFAIFAPSSMSGRMVNCSVANISLATVSGELVGCELSGVFRNGSFTGTALNCVFGQVGTTASTISGVFSGCRFTADAMQQTTDSTSGVWSATSIGCKFKYMPYALDHAEVITKAVTGIFQSCEFEFLSASSNIIPVVVGATFIGCIFRQSITPTEDAVFSGCSFIKTAGFDSMVAPLRVRPRSRSKTLAGTTCVVQVRCPYATYSADFVQAGDTIKIDGIGFEYDGIHTVDSIASGTNGGIAITYTNTNVTADEAETTVGITDFAYVEWVNYGNNRCRITGCYFDETATEKYWGLGLSRWQKVIGDGNRFASDPFQTLTYDQELYPFHQVVKGDATAVGEVSEIWVLNNTVAGGEYIDLEDGTGAVRVWLDLDNGTSAPATPPGGRLLEVDVTTGMTREQIQQAISSVLNADSKFSTTIIRSNALSHAQTKVVCLDGGNRTDISTSTPALFGVRKIADGATDLTLTAMPAANTQEFNILNAEGGNVILDGYGAETINGAATDTLASQYDSAVYHSDGTNLFVK